MREIILDQKNMFVISLALGAAMSFGYDLLRCLRMAISHGGLLIGIEDILYWIFWTYIIIDSIQRYSYGSLRVYIFFGIAVGAVAYITTISRLLLYIVSHILCFVKKCLKKLNILLKKSVKKGKITLSLSKGKK